MTAPLPPHVATADEPIPVPGGRPLFNEPDMRAVTPLETMLAELAHVADDDVAFVAQFRVYIREIGCTLMAHYGRDGTLGVSLGSPVDVQVRHRSRWAHFLFERLDAAAERRELLLRSLVDDRVYCDERPSSPRETTRAMRGFLQAGGRILVSPRGRIEEGGCGTALSLTDPRAGVSAAAARRYLDVRHRYRADRQIRRAVRMLGRVENGWRVLEART